MGGDSWLPRYLRESQDSSHSSWRSQWYKSKGALIALLWLLLILIVLVMRPFAWVPTSAAANNYPVKNAPPLNNAPVSNAPAGAVNWPPVKNTPGHVLDWPPIDHPVIPNNPAAHRPGQNAPVHNTPANNAPPPSPPADNSAAAANSDGSLLILNHAATRGHYWNGWDKVSHMFVFGDSFTTTRFLPQLEQPSVENPLGNPPWPGNSSAAGPNWVPFLTGRYNGTFMKTANLARGAATTDDEILAPFIPVGHSFRQQLENWWWPNYGRHQQAEMDWDSENTLFALWTGLNDVLGINGGRNTTPTLQPVIDSFGVMVDSLYQGGARNFLFLNLPPHDRSPASHLAHDVEGRAYHGKFWNENLLPMVSNFSDTYADVTSFVFDAYTLFTQILEDPCSYELTCGLRNLTRACSAYDVIMLPSDSYSPECGVPIGQYFWKDRVHPTFTVQNATAKEIADALRKYA